MPAAFYDEMNSRDGHVRAHYRGFQDWLSIIPPQYVDQKRAEADSAFHRVGITFAVYGEDAGQERLIPFDIIPRIIPRAEWAALEVGLEQRARALNAFIHDVYHDHRIVRAGVVPAEHIFGNAQYRPEMQGVDVPMAVYTHMKPPSAR